MSDQKQRFFDQLNDIRNRINVLVERFGNLNDMKSNELETYTKLWEEYDSILKKSRSALNMNHKVPSPMRYGKNGGKLTRQQKDSNVQLTNMLRKGRESVGDEQKKISLNRLNVVAPRQTVKYKRKIANQKRFKEQQEELKITQEALDQTVKITDEQDIELKEQRELLRQSEEARNKILK
jgi:hypothetical protein